MEKVSETDDTLEINSEEESDVEFTDVEDNTIHFSGRNLVYSGAAYLREIQEATKKIQA